VGPIVTLALMPCWFICGMHACTDRYNILVYLVTFALSWLLFALLWWSMQGWHGAGQPCVDGVHDFTTALLFSIETQHTIGYGSRAVTDRCSGAVALLMVQSVFGAVTQCIVTGIIFAKVYTYLVFFSARCNMYISRLCYACQCPSVCDGSALAHIANLAFQIPIPVYRALRSRCMRAQGKGSTQPCIPLGKLNRVLALIGWGKGGLLPGGRLHSVIPYGT